MKNDGDAEEGHNPTGVPGSSENPGDENNVVGDTSTLAGDLRLGGQRQQGDASLAGGHSVDQSAGARSLRLSNRGNGMEGAPGSGTERLLGAMQTDP